MRRVGNLPTAHDASAFSDFLHTRGIENNAETEDDGSFSVWVHDDDRVAEAGEHLAHYRSAPDSPEFRDAGAEAVKIRQAETKAGRRRRSEVIDEARIGYERSRHFSGIIPLLLLVLSAAATLWTNYGHDRKAFGLLAISERHYLHEQLSEENASPEIAALISTRFLPEVRAGQVWRVFTPIFVHMSLAHIVMNMMVLFQLGNFFESRFGPWRLLWFVLGTAAISNVMEYWWSSANFGGMSGVVYALFGFLWMKGRFGRGQDWQLSTQTVQWMLVWLVLCYTGVFGPIANAAHTGGLLAGVAWGFGSARVWPLIEQRLARGR